MSQEPFVFLELQKDTAFLPVHIERAPRQRMLRHTRVSIRPIGIHLTWDALAQCGFGVEDITRLCTENKEQIRLAFTPKIAPGYVRFTFTYVEPSDPMNTPACLDLTISHKPYHVYARDHSADIVPFFCHSHAKKVG